MILVVILPREEEMMSQSSTEKRQDLAEEDWERELMADYRIDEDGTEWEKTKKALGGRERKTQRNGKSGTMNYHT